MTLAFPWHIYNYSTELEMGDKRRANVFSLFMKHVSELLGFDREDFGMALQFIGPCNRGLGGAPSFRCKSFGPLCLDVHIMPGF